MSVQPYVDPALTLGILLAGGRGSRLHELCDEECKPAVPFAGGRLVDLTLANVVRSKLDRLMVATQYKPRSLETYLERIWAEAFPSGLVPRYGPFLLPGGYRGTADAVRANLPEIMASGARYALILSADHVYQMDYRPMIAEHLASGALITVAVDKVPLALASGFGVLSTASDGRITRFTEKPERPEPAPDAPDQALVSMGVYVIDIAYLAAVLLDPEMQDFGKDILPRAVAGGVARSYRAASSTDKPFYWRDVGTLDSYRAAALDCLEPGRAPVDLPIPLARHDARLTAAETGTVLLPAAQIARGARVTNAIIATGTRVPPDLVIGEDPEEDRRWFRCAPQGTVLVTERMLWQRALRRRPVYRAS